jgi:hypothetical protein
MSDIRYVLKNKETGKYIALDKMSGGYPYDVDTIWRAKKWENPADAILYTAVSSWKDYDHPVYSMEAVTVVTTPAPMPTGADLEVVRRVDTRPVVR